jgi:DeoR family fructose operon transcriptional repressor
MVSNLHAAVAFIATNGIDGEVGFTTPDIDESEVKRMMIQNAQETIVLADHSKFSHVFTSCFAEVTAVDRVITDIGAPLECVESLRRNEVEVVLT